MRSDLRVALACAAAVVAGCAGFGRGEPAPDAGCDPTAGPPGYDRDVASILNARCKTCHSPSGAAKSSDLLIGASLAEDHELVVALVDLESPEDSALLVKGTGGDSHGGGTPLSPASRDYAKIVEWIEAGALLSGSGCAVIEPDAGLPGDAGTDAAPEDAATGDAATGDASAGGDASTKDASTKDAGAEDAGADAAIADAAVVDAAVDSGPVEVPDYGSEVYPLLFDDCEACHNATGVAKSTSYLLTGSSSSDYDMIVDLVNPDDPPASALLTNMIGDDHDGGERFSASSKQYELVRDWIAGGAPK